MRLRPNPPRLVTVAIALALGVLGFILAWPVEPLLSLLDPIERLLAPYGIDLSPELGFLGLFLCPSLLVVGSLLPDI